MSSAVSAALTVVIVAAVSAAVLRVIGFSATPAVVCLGAVAALSLLSEGLSKTVGTVLSFVSAGEFSEYLGAATRIIGVGYIAGICQESCEALGEASLGRAAALVGRIETVVIALPYFVQIMQTGLEMVS